MTTDEATVQVIDPEVEADEVPFTEEEGVEDTFVEFLTDKEKEVIDTFWSYRSLVPNVEDYKHQSEYVAALVNHVTKLVDVGEEMVTIIEGLNSDICDMSGDMDNDEDELVRMRERIPTLLADQVRLRWMINYALTASKFESAKIVLNDALDGVSGHTNYKEVRGEKQAAEAKLLAVQPIVTAAIRLVGLSKNDSTTADGDIDTAWTELTESVSALLDKK